MIKRPKESERLRMNISRGPLAKGFTQQDILGEDGISRKVLDTTSPLTEGLTGQRLSSLASPLYSKSHTNGSATLSQMPPCVRNSMDPLLTGKPTESSLTQPSKQIATPAKTMKDAEGRTTGVIGNSMAAVTTKMTMNVGLSEVVTRWTTSAVAPTSLLPAERSAIESKVRKRSLEEKVSAGRVNQPHERSMDIDFGDVADTPEVPESTTWTRNQLTMRRNILARISPHKTELMRICSTALMHEPNLLDASNTTYKEIEASAQLIAIQDPEFLLKLALYVRRELGIRSIANFLLAIASEKEATAKHLEKYFCKTVNLPSDWLDVAKYAWFRNYIKTGANQLRLPRALRKVLTAKFRDFDEYQLAKYNKPGSRKVAGKKDLAYSSTGPDPVVLDRIKRLTMKRMVQWLHIRYPAQYVMALTGKKYPLNVIEFQKTGLPGTYDEQRAGKRMRLVTPVTWDRQLSEKGNRKETWEYLWKKRKLPFMAMIRNLRNLLLSQIDEKCFGDIILMLQNEEIIARSRQLPSQFMAAFDALREIQDVEHYLDRSTKKGKPKNKVDVRKTIRGRPLGQVAQQGALKGERLLMVRRILSGVRRRGTSLDMQLLRARTKQLQRALNRSVELAATRNIPPISGKTLMLLELPSDATIRKGMSTRHSTTQSPKAKAALMAAMLYTACEDCVIFGNDGRRFDVPEAVNLFGVADAMKRCGHTAGCDSSVVKILTDLIRRREHVDHLVAICDGPTTCLGTRALLQLLHAYRTLVNPTFLYIQVTAGRQKPINEVVFSPKDYDAIDPFACNLFLSGVSDKIFLVIARGGAASQIEAVEKIDIDMHLNSTQQDSLRTLRNFRPMLDDTAVKRLTNDPTRRGQWEASCQKECRIFVSSTFRDMHGERRVLAKYVFPELRRIFHPLHINIYEVDLRWGLTSDQMDSSGQLQACIDTVRHCDLFLGLLGERYGYVPSLAERVRAANALEEPWLAQGYDHASITELELTAFAFENEDLTKVQCSQRTVILLRDPGALQKVPPDELNSFVAESPDAAERMRDLKTKIWNSGLEAVHTYNASWGRAHGSVAELGDLKGFAHTVMSALVQAVESRYPEEVLPSIRSRHPSESRHHVDDARHLLSAEVSVRNHGESLAYFDQQLFEHWRSDVVQSLVLVHGPYGCGKSAFLGRAVQHLFGNENVRGQFNVFVHFVGAASTADDLGSLFKRLVRYLNAILNIFEDFDSTNFAIACLPRLFQDVQRKTGRPTIVVVDGIDRFVNIGDGPKAIDWIPPMAAIGGSVLFYLSLQSSAQILETLNHRFGIHVREVQLPTLNRKDAASLVRQSLRRYHRSLDEAFFNNQMNLLLSKRDAKATMYLRIACDYLRIHSNHDDLSHHIRELPSTVQGLLKLGIEKLEDEVGSLLVRLACSLLVLSPEGLYMWELQQLLNSLGDDEPVDWEITGFQWLQLRSGLKLLFESSPKIQASEDVPVRIHNDFVHAILTARYLTGSMRKERIHKRLCSYYKGVGEAQNTNGEPIPFGKATQRSLRLLAYHTVISGQLDEVVSLLSDFSYLSACFREGLSSFVMDMFLGHEDSMLFFSPTATDAMREPLCESMFRFVIQRQHIFLRAPDIVVQEALLSDDEEIQQHAVGYLKRVPQVCPRLRPWSLRASHFPAFEKMRPVTSFRGSHVNITSITASTWEGESMIFIGYEDGSVQVLNSETMAHRSTLMPFVTSELAELSFVNSQGILIAGTDTGICLAWDLKSGKCLYSFNRHTRQVDCIAVAPHEDYFASGGRDGKIVIQELHRATVIVVLVAKEAISPVSSLGYSPHSDFLYAAYWDGNIRVWSVSHKQQVSQYSFVQRQPSVRCAALAERFNALNGGDHMAVQFRRSDNTLVTLTATSGAATVASYRYTYHTAPFLRESMSVVDCDVVGRRQALVASGFVNGDLLIENKYRHRMLVRLKAAPCGASVCALAFNPWNPKILAIGDANGHIHLVDNQGRELGPVLNVPKARTGLPTMSAGQGMRIATLLFSRDGGYLLAGFRPGSHSSARLFDMRRQVGMKVDHNELTDPVLGLALSGIDGGATVTSLAMRMDVMLVGTDLGSIIMYAMPNRGKLKIHSKRILRYLNPIRSTHVHNGTVTALEIAALPTAAGKCKEDIIISASKDGSITITDINTMTTIWHDEFAHEGGVEALAFEHSIARKFVSGGADCEVKIWDIENAGRRVKLSNKAIGKQKSSVTSIEWLPQYRILVAAFDGSVQVFDDSGKLFSCICPSGMPPAVAASAQKMVGSSSQSIVAILRDNGEIDLWSSRISESILFPGHTGAVKSVCALPNGNFASLGAGDRTIHIWDPSAVEDACLGFTRETRVLSLAKTTAFNSSLPSKRVVDSGAKATLSHMPFSSVVSVEVSIQSSGKSKVCIPEFGLPMCMDAKWLILPAHDRPGRLSFVGASLTHVIVSTLDVCYSRNGDVECTVTGSKLWHLQPAQLATCIKWIDIPSRRDHVLLTTAGGTICLLNVAKDEAPHQIGRIDSGHIDATNGTCDGPLGVVKFSQFKHLYGSLFLMRTLHDPFTRIIQIPKDAGQIRLIAECPDLPITAVVVDVIDQGETTPLLLRLSAEPNFDLALTLPIEKDP